MAALLDLSAVAQATLLRRRELSSEELVRLYLDRIQRLNPVLHSFVEIFADEALKEARTKDAELGKKRADLPPFFGVPSAIKDMNLVRRHRTRFGSRAGKLGWSPVDDRTTARMREAGFVFLGKLGTSEYGAMPITEPDIHPPCANPWALTRTPGGSSGGSGAAVAAGLVPIAQGSDGAGSIRIPAAFCHLYGLKPARGRLRNAFMLPDEHVLYTDGPLARTVDDAAAMLDAMAGITVGKPHWAPPPPRPFGELAREAPSRLTIRFATRVHLADTHPAARDLVLSTARCLEGLGHHVEEAPLTDIALETFLPLWQKLIADMPLVRWDDTQPVTRWLALAGKQISRARVEELGARLESELLSWFGDADLWLTPTVPELPPLLGLARIPESPESIFARAAQLGAYTATFNITGQPAASLPLGLTEDGLPLGVQIAGRRFDEATVLAISRVLESEMPWKGRTAPLYRA